MAGVLGERRDGKDCRSPGHVPGSASLALLVDVVNSRRVPVPASGFEDFYRTNYQALVREVIFAGGDTEEAKDAVSAAMVEVLQRWDTITHPRAYARRAAVSNLIKSKQRGLPRIHERLIQRGEVSVESALDPGLTVWEQREWVTQLLKSLPPAQREVLTCIVDNFSGPEIAQLLGKTEAAVRQNLRAARKSLANCLAEVDGAEAAASARGRRLDER
jgi:RNA polymerase sigma factor (sigma-70 family)